LPMIMVLRSFLGGAAQLKEAVQAHKVAEPCGFRSFLSVVILM